MVEAQRLDTEEKHGGSPFISLGAVETAGLFGVFAIMALSGWLYQTISIGALNQWMIIAVMAFFLGMIIWNGFQRAKLLRIARKLHAENRKKLAALKESMRNKLGPDGLMGK